MSLERKAPQTKCLPSINYKQFISLIILLLVTSSTTQSASAKYECPGGCECNEDALSARCDDLDQLIESYSRHNSRHNYMPIKSLDLSNNHLTKLTNQLELLTNLTELNLSHNQLTQVHKLNFDHLEKLDLSFNRITSAKLKKLPKNVVHLNLTNNEITYLPLGFMKLKALRNLELAGNPLNCTCDTLLVRNWMSYQHVMTEKPIICTSPLIVKGQPWLQARSQDICFEPSTTTTQRSKYNWDNYEDENENMLGDQPQPDDDPDDVEYEEEEEEEQNDAKDEEKQETKDVFADEDEKPETVDDEPEPEEKEKEKPDDDLDEEFIAVTPEPGSNDGSTAEPETVSKDATELEDEDEGSGGEIVASVSETPEDDTDESGSGIPIFIPSGVHKDDIESSTYSQPDTIPTLGIFEDNTEAPIGAQNDVLKNPEVESTHTDNESSPVQSGDLKTASSGDDNTGTYVLLGILALCLISLMIFVAMKNRQEKNRNRRYDIEKNGATELQDMDKRLLGKPLDRNGNDNGNGRAEQAPLINDYPVHKDERPTALTSFQPPEITVEKPTATPREKEKSQQSLYENLPNGNGHVEPINGTRSPDSDEEVFHPASETPADPESLNVSPDAPKRYSPIYTPASPRSERYSPVYSPETGRVKIKLTETPKPKTPVVVTRSRSRAGDYINTPN